VAVLEYLTPLDPIWPHLAVLE